MTVSRDGKPDMYSRDYMGRDKVCYTDSRAGKAVAVDWAAAGRRRGEVETAGERPCCYQPAQGTAVAVNCHCLRAQAPGTMVEVEALPQGEPAQVVEQLPRE